MSAGAPRLRPPPHGPCPAGPYRPVPGEPGKLVRFPSKGERVARFIEGHCVFTSRRWARRPFVLQPWQRQLVLDLFEVDPQTRRRRYRWALIGMPRKNGKTELLAAIALYLLLGDDGDDTPQIACAATSEEQADLIFTACQRMAAYSPTLGPLVEVFGDEIQRRDMPEAKIVRRSSKVRSTHGLNLSAVIMDELHEWPPGSGDELWEVLTTSMSAGEEPLVLQITTAGFDLEGTVCGRQYQHCRRVESGEVADRAYFFRWWQAPDGCALDDEAAIQAANPAYGVIKSRAYFEDIASRIRPPMFRRLELNQWTEAESEWLPEGAWERCRAPDLVRFDPALPVFVGWDASTKYDSTALVAVQPAEIEGVERLRVYSWIWERPYDARLNRPVEDWLIPLEEEVLPVIRWLAANFPVRGIAFDPAFISWEAGKLAGGGLPMLEFPQHTARMSEASQALYEDVVSGRVAHAGQPALSRHIANAVARQERASAWRLVKGKAARKMDGAIALAMAVWLVRHAEPPKPKATPGIWFPDDDEALDDGEGY